MTERGGASEGLEDTLVPSRGPAEPSKEEAHADTLVRSGPVPSEGSSRSPRVTHEHPGRYGGEEEVGRGGLGLVSATYDSHLARRVARKELLPERPGDASASGEHSQAVARFLREARVTAQLEHPNIVPVYELGQRDDGSLYYTMKLVRGRTLKAAIEAADEMQDRLSLLSHFVDLCQAIGYAHSRGVIHRDIKPDNVMIGEFGETLVLDWGVAKLRGSEDLRGGELAEAVARLRDEEGAHTLPGSAFGTPVYMAPEQAEGQIEAVDERSDVWALGVVLYQLLSGRIPYPNTHVLAVLVKASKAEIVPLEEVCEDAPPELAAVVRRALSPDKADRYDSAKALADDVLAFQSGHRVDAYRYSTREVVARFVAEHRAAVTVSAVAALILLVVLAGAYVGLREERDRARAAEAAGRAHFADALVERARVHEREHDWVGVELLAAESLALSDNPAARGLLVGVQDGLRPELEWSERTYSGCARIAVASAADSIFCGTSFGIARLDATSGAQTARLQMPGGWVRALAVSQDGRRLAAGGDGAELVVYDLEGAVLGRRALQSPALAVAFWRVGSEEVPVAVLEQGALVRFDGDDLEPQVVYSVSEPVARAAIGPAAAVFSDAFGHVVVHDGEALVRFDPGHGGPLSALAISASGQEIATAGPDRAVRIFDARGQLLGPVRDRGLGVVTALGFAGRMLLAGSEDGEVLLVDLSRRRVRARFVAHEGAVDHVHLAPGGLVSAGQDRMVRRYRGEVPNPRAAIDPRLLSTARSVALAGDGGQVALAGGWGLAVLAEAGPQTVSESAFESVAVSRDGKWLAAGNAGGGMSWRTVASDGAVWTDLEPVAAPIAALAFDEQAAHLYALARSQELVEVDVAKRSARILAHGAPDGASSLVADGPWLAFSVGTQVELRRTSGAAISRREATSSEVTALALDAGRARLAVGDASGGLTLLTLPSLAPVARFTALRGKVRALAFATDGALSALGDGGDARVYALDVLDEDPRRLLRDLERRRGVRLDGLRLVPR